ncbi:type II toxin-antitoxin system VapC family toxin [Halochromatium sp.]
MKPRVYVETSVVSYLTAWHSRDLVVAGNQETTRELWERRDEFELFISRFVLEEASAGDPGGAQRRLSVLDGLPEIDITGEVEHLAETLLSRVALPPTAKLDALHIALAAIGGMDYLLTWNCAHIANPALRRPMSLTIQALGYEPPIICTPLELLEV